MRAPVNALRVLPLSPKLYQSNQPVVVGHSQRGNTQLGSKLVEVVGFNKRGIRHVQNESSGSQIIGFSTFELDVRTGELRKGGAKMKLQEQPLRILEMLVVIAGCAQQSTRRGLSCSP